MGTSELHVLLSDEEVARETSDGSLAPNPLRSMNDTSGQPRALCSRYTRYWPRRLLHVQSMRSLERQGSDTYGASSPIRKPRYATVSYTWGRFETSCGSRLSIYGIPWRPPIIDPNHFTVEHFENTIRSIASMSGVEFLWLDVACTEFSKQPVISTVNEEICMQREIFLGASQNFIWLTGTEGKILAEVFTTPSHITNNTHGEQDIASENSGSGLSKTIFPALKRLLTDRWFSSLWTLQEAMVSPHAILLSAEGFPISLPLWARQILDRERQIEIIFGNGSSVWPTLPVEEPNSYKHENAEEWVRTGYATLRHLVELCRSIFTSILSRADHLPRDSDERRALEDMSNTITRSGIKSLSSSNLLHLWKIAQNRHEMHLGDRIEYIHRYVFRFPTGPGTPFADSTSSNFQREAYFSEELILHFPVLSQLFSRLYPSEEGFSWQLDQGCEFLDLDLLFTSFGEYIPQVTTKRFITEDRPHYIELKGSACNFGNAMKLLLDQSLSSTQLMGISFDCTTVHLPHKTICIPDMVSVPKRQTTLQTRLQSPESQRWCIASEEQLQHITTINHLVEDTDADVRILILAQAPRLRDGPELAIGLIVLRDQGNADTWLRIGFCFWTFQSGRETERGTSYGLERLDEGSLEDLCIHIRMV